ncbi:MAG TPA: carboxyltransferase domain-containing protein, partial [Thermoanaerobaculia bacterium]|nr:carboxyltransferase domain-containing protein [Thermoanaerobaculia bacterium]
MTSRIDVRDVVDGAILIGYPDADEEEANRRVVAAARGLTARAPVGLLDAVPAARTLLVLFDPRRLAHEHLARALRKDR